MSLRHRRSRPDARTIGVAALAGVGAFLAGYLVVTVLTILPFRDGFMSQVLSRAGRGDWVGTGWVLYEAQFVELHLDDPAFGVGLLEVQGRTPAEGLPSQYGVGDGHVALLRVVPPLLLATAGAAVTRRAGVTNARAGAVTGAAVAIGYAPAIVGGLVVFGIREHAVLGTVLGLWNFLVPVSELLWPIALVGLVYPVVFGGIGGALGADVQAPP